MLLALATVLAISCYYAAPQLLCVQSPGAPRAEMIVVLGGEAFGRPKKAAELFRAQAAPAILITGNGDYSEVRRALIAKGVPEAAITIEKESGSTMENAVFSARLLRERGVKQAILVTSWYHSRRALRCFRHAAPEIEFLSAPSDYGWRRADWSRTGVGAQIRYEYLKLLGYWVKYGVAPF